MNKEFRHIVIEQLGKSVRQIELEVALGYFVNHQGNPFNLHADAAIAWQASAAFMKEMEKAYSMEEHVSQSEQDRPEDSADEESLNEQRL